MRPFMPLSAACAPQPCSLVKRAMHGTRMMGWTEIRQSYGREVRTSQARA